VQEIFVMDLLVDIYQDVTFVERWWNLIWCRQKLFQV